MSSLDLILSQKHGSNKTQTTSYKHAKTQDVIDKHKYVHHFLTSNRYKINSLILL
jgi:hypothetical protein